MIEFKAECGHTVRARDENAGGAVRCAYCGKTVPVPDPGTGGLDFLFDEVQAQAPEERSRWRRKKRPPAAPRVRKPSEIDPLGIVKRLCYFTLLIIILIVVGRKVVLPLLDKEERARRLAGSAAPPAAATQEGPQPNSGATEKFGLRADGHVQGLYVASVPDRATAFLLAEDRAPRSGRIAWVSGAYSIRTDGSFARLPDGSYVIEVAIPWNDPGLNDPSLPSHAGFVAFRRSLERASDAQRKQLQDEYFLPDEAQNTFVAEEDDQIYFVRQYRGVTVQDGHSKGVRALFLPRMGLAANKGFAIEPLLFGLIPSEKRYGFDERLVRGELNFFGVSPADQPAVMDALSRIGLIPYALPDGRVRIFKIDIHDGAFTSRVIREAPQ